MKMFAKQMQQCALLAVLLTCGAVGTAAAQSSAPVSVDANMAEPRELPMSIEGRYDPVRLDGGERLGLLSTAILFEVSPNWWMGPTVVGAAAGQRGGYLVMGGQVERRWRLSEQWRAQLSFMAGGGSGADAPVGSGLLLVPSASLMYDWGPVQTGLSWSRVRTPGGGFDSQQWGVVLSWDGRFTFFDASDVGRSAGRAEGTGFGFDRVMLSHAWLRVRAQDNLPATSVRLTGVRVERSAGPHLFWGMESAAASHGSADGYMEILGSGGWETSAGAIGLDGLYLGGRAALGLGGGGKLRTGGGVLGKAAGVLRWEVGRDAVIGVEAGLVRSDSGRYRARYAQLQLGLQLDHPGSTDPATVHGVSWSASIQHLAHAARTGGGEIPLDTIGIKASSPLGEQFYLTGQAHSQVTGEAGAYCIGLAGLGWRAPLPSQTWSLSAELLAGAAGGGGFDTRGGAAAQGMVYLGRAVGRSAEVQIGAGRVRSLNGGLNSAVLDITWTQRFGVGLR